CAAQARICKLAGRARRRVGRQLADRAGGAPAPARAISGATLPAGPPRAPPDQASWRGRLRRLGARQRSPQRADQAGITRRHRARAPQARVPPGDLEGKAPAAIVREDRDPRAGERLLLPLPPECLLEAGVRRRLASQLAGTPVRVGQVARRAAQQCADPLDGGPKILAHLLLAGARKIDVPVPVASHLEAPLAALDDLGVTHQLELQVLARGIPAVAVSKPGGGREHGCREAVAFEHRQGPGEGAAVGVVERDRHPHRAARGWRPHQLIQGDHAAAPGQEVHLALEHVERHERVPQLGSGDRPHRVIGEDHAARAHRRRTILTRPILPANAASPAQTGQQGPVANLRAVSSATKSNSAKVSSDEGAPPSLTYSTVIATKDRAARAREAILQMLAQSRRPVRIIVVDASSPPLTLAEDLRREVARAGIELSVLHAPASTSRQRNVGVEHVETPLVLLLDDDVALQPDYVEVLLERWQRDGLDAWGAMVGAPQHMPAQGPLARAARRALMLHYQAPGGGATSFRRSRKLRLVPVPAAEVTVPACGAGYTLVRTDLLRRHRF